MCVCGGGWWVSAAFICQMTGDLNSIFVKDFHDICTVRGPYPISVNYSYEYKIAKVEGYPYNVVCKHVIAWLSDGIT
jgi:hypothetical protein